MTKVTTDRHAMYLASVQDPTGDIERVSKIYKELFNKSAMSFREDFAGTFALSCTFVCSGPERTAIAIDLDRETIEYGEKNYYANLDESEKRRLSFKVANSISKSRPVDIACAFNFSYCLFHSRSMLLDYFKNVHNSLNNQGMIILDIFGGSESEIPEVQEIQ